MAAGSESDEADRAEERCRRDPALAEHWVDWVELLDRSRAGRPGRRGAVRGAAQLQPARARAAHGRRPARGRPRRSRRARAGDPGRARDRAADGARRRCPPRRRGGGARAGPGAGRPGGAGQGPRAARHRRLLDRGLLAGRGDPGPVRRSKGARRSGALGRPRPWCPTIWTWRACALRTRCRPTLWRALSRGRDALDRGAFDDALSRGAQRGARAAPSWGWPTRCWPRC